MIVCHDTVICCVFFCRDKHHSKVGMNITIHRLLLVAVVILFKVTLHCLAKSGPINVESLH